MNIKSLIKIFLVMASIGLAIFLYFYLTNRATLVISAPEGSEILVSESVTAEPVLIGKTSATFKTRKAGTVYVFAKKEGKQTQTSAEVELRKKSEVSLSLKNTVVKKSIGDGPLAFMFFENNFVYGVNPDTRSIAYRPLANDQIPDVNFIKIPFVKKVSWTDTKNYVYSTFGRGVQNVINSQVYESISMGEQNLPTKFLDFGQASGKPIALINERGIYTTSNFLGTDIKQIAKLSNLQGTISLFSDADYIYFANQTYSDATDEGEEAPPTATKITVFDYSGKVISTIDLPEPKTVDKIVSINNGSSFGVVAQDQFYLFDSAKKSISATPYYFSGTKDLLYIDGRLIVLNDTGLWEYENKSSSFYLLNAFGEGEEYVPNSLANTKGGVIFSSGASRDAIINNSAGDSKIYQVNL